MDDLAQKLLRLLASALTPVSLLDIIEPLLILAAEFVNLGSVSKAAFDEVIIPLLHGNAVLLDEVAPATIVDLFAVCFEVLPTFPLSLIDLVRSLSSPQCTVSPRSKALVARLCHVYLEDALYDTDCAVRKVPLNRGMLSSLVLSTSRSVSNLF